VSGTTEPDALRFPSAMPPSSRTPVAVSEVVGGWWQDFGMEIVASTWVCVRGRRLLVVRSAGNDAFYVPGGKVEPGETLAEAAAREVKEETGISLDVAELRPFSEIVAPAYGRPGVDVRLVSFTAPSDAEPQPCAEIEEIAWFGTAQSDRCAPAIRLLIGELAAAGLID
jgi:8-oxo-dGTP pyrophosphatase MutT (NUDIX family)